MALKRPPEHRADGAALLIVGFDEAWDKDRIEAERKGLPKGHDHPVDVYGSGETRFDIEAPITVGGQAVQIRSYLRPDASPTVFHLQRPPGIGLEREQAVAVMGRPREWKAALWRMASLGVKKITDGFQGDTWTLEGGNGFPLTTNDLQALYEVHPKLPEVLGIAVINYAESLTSAEKKP